MPSLRTIFHAAAEGILVFGMLVALNGLSGFTHMPLLIETVPTEAADFAPAVTRSAPRTSRLLIVSLVLVLVAGCFLRVPDYVFAPSNATLHWLAPLHPSPKFDGFGFDEKLYRGYVSVLMFRGIGVYPELGRKYVQEQTKLESAI